jgi:glutamyl-tRNA reductase
VHLVVVGIHQRTAPLELRERLAFDEARLAGALTALREYATEGLILSTCNRVEVYGALDVAQAEPLERFLAGWHGMAPQELAPYRYVHVDREAVRHLFRLAAGLDSMVLGEDQIVGQIKAAYAQAHAAGLTGHLLSRLVHRALAAGKLVRTQTAIARSHLSVVSVALDLARQSLSGLAGRHVVVVGAGRMAGLALAHLRADSPRLVTVVNRTFERARMLAERYGASACPWDGMEEALRGADVALACTAAPEIVVPYEVVARAVAGRASPLLVLDLAVPRDVDPRVAALPVVQLYDVDSMQAICAANRAARAAEVADAEALIEEEVQQFMRWWASRRAVPAIRALRARAQAIVQAELRRTLARLPDLAPSQRAAIEAMGNAIVNKLLHYPIVTLKDPAAGVELARAAERLFRLDDCEEGGCQRISRAS